jgi:hypothetical protein
LKQERGHGQSDQESADKAASLSAARQVARQAPRVGVFLADTLAEPGAAAPDGKLGFVADNIRTEQT